jgi:hypothetical protein
MIIDSLPVAVTSLTIVRGESPYYYTELLYRRHPSLRPRSSIRPRPRSRQPRVLGLK